MKIIGRTIRWRPKTFIIFSFLVNFGVGDLQSNYGGKGEISENDKTIDTQLECNDSEPICKTDKLSLKAIHDLHSLMDDDHDGSVNKQETDGFFLEEMKDSGKSDAAAIFKSNDSVISAEGLWKAWVDSEVHNWTVDQVVHWLEYHVHLPQYSAIFRANNIDGRSIPRFSTTKGTNLKKELGIKNKTHRKKIAFMAMQLVVVGPPKEGIHVMKVFLPLVTMFVILVSVCWYAFSENNKSKTQLKRMLTEMESLQKAEYVQKKPTTTKDLETIKNLKRKEPEQTCLIRITAAKKEAERLKVAREESREELNRLKLAEEELVQVRRALKQAESELERTNSVASTALRMFAYNHKKSAEQSSASLSVRRALKQAESELERTNSVASTALRELLQATYDKELSYFNKVKSEASEQFRRVREECERLSKKGVGFLGAIKVVGSLHNDAIYAIDRQIIEARTALQTVELYRDERIKRWENIEQICGYTLSKNQGSRNTLSFSTHKRVKSATGEFGSTSSLPKSWAPNTDQRRDSNNSNLTDDISNDSIITDLTEGSMQSLERIPTIDVEAEHSLKSQDFSSSQDKQFPHVRKQKSYDVTLLRNRKGGQDNDVLKRTNSDHISVKNRSQSDMHLDKMNYSASFTYGQYGRESQLQNKTKKRFKLMDRASHFINRMLR